MKDLNVKTQRNAVCLEPGDYAVYLRSVAEGQPINRNGDLPPFCTTLLGFESDAICGRFTFETFESPEVYLPLVGRWFHVRVAICSPDYSVATFCRLLPHESLDDEDDDDVSLIPDLKGRTPETLQAIREAVVSAMSDLS